MMLRMIPDVEGLPPVEMKPVRGMVHCGFLPQDQTVNQVYKQIRQRLFCSVREKNQDLWESDTWLLHHNDAPALTALSIRKLLAEKNIVVLKHSPIHQVLLRVTFSFSSKLKTSLKEHIFKHGRYKNAITKELWGIHQESFQECIDT